MQRAVLGMRWEFEGRLASCSCQCSLPSINRCCRTVRDGRYIHIGDFDLIAECHRSGCEHIFHHPAEVHLSQRQDCCVERLTSLTNKIYRLSSQCYVDIARHEGESLHLSAIEIGPSAPMESLQNSFNFETFLERRPSAGLGALICCGDALHWPL